MKKIAWFVLIALSVSVTTSKAQNIDRIEYFINADPGFGNGVPISFTTSTDVANLSFAADVTPLPVGIHRLHMRSRRADGAWSITNSWTFFKAMLSSSSDITSMEYFFDTDPGFGNGTPVNLVPANSITDYSIIADISSIPNGLHRLFIRSKNSSGAWSILNSWMFFKSGQFSPVNITRLEYFFDTDPGFGNGTSVPIAAAVNVSDFSFSPSISALGLGLHTLFIRTQSNDGSWSQTTQWLFYKASIAGAGNISALEYFIDADPGFGKATALPITPSTDLADLTFDINVALLSAGTHRLYVRSRDAAGNWSISNVIEFNRTFPLPVDWLSFTAEKQDRQVLLQWKTENQVNNDRYEAEHSVDGISFHTIATLTSQNGPGPHEYSHLHQNPKLDGINYYRIRQVDADGRYSYSITRSVMLTEGLVSVSPNPAKDFVDIRSNERNILLRLFDQNGRLVRTLSFSGGYGRADVKDLAPGNYLLIIEKHGKVIASSKLLKM